MVAQGNGARGLLAALLWVGFTPALAIDVKLSSEEAQKALEAGRIAVGMVFLPRTDLGAQERCRIIVETEILRAGLELCGHGRQVALVQVRVIFIYAQGGEVVVEAGIPADLTRFLTG